MAVRTTHLALLCLAATQALAQLPLRLVTFNIRYDNTDVSSGDAEKVWLSSDCADDTTLCRAPGVISTLNNTSTEASGSGAETIIGLQEVLDNQLTDILDGLGSPWAHLGVARDDGDTDGEYSPILYRTDVFNIVYSETKWLSETPDEPSKSWDSGSNRIVTIGVFEHTSTGRRFMHANTHLDNASPEARANQIGVAVDMMQAVDATYGPGLPVSLTGDFNSADTDGAYLALVAENYVQDVYTLATAEQRSERFYTWTGFRTMNKYQVLDNLVNGSMISDHRPVAGDITLG